MKLIKEWLQESRELLQKKKYDVLESRTHLRGLESAVDQTAFPGKGTFEDAPAGFVITSILVIDKYLEALKAHNEKIDEIQRSHKGKYLEKARAEQMKKMPSLDAHMDVVKTFADVIRLYADIQESRTWDNPPTADFQYLQNGVELTISDIERLYQRNQYNPIFCRSLKKIFDENFDTLESIDIDLRDAGTIRRNAIDDFSKMAYQIMNDNDGMSHALYHSPEVGAYNNIAKALGEQPISEKPDNNIEQDLVSGIQGGAVAGEQ